MAAPAANTTASSAATATGPAANDAAAVVVGPAVGRPVAGTVLAADRRISSPADVTGPEVAQSGNTREVLPMGKRKCTRRKDIWHSARAARHIATNKLVAIKSLCGVRPDIICLTGCIKEVLFYTHLGKHPNLVKLSAVTNIGGDHTGGPGHCVRALREKPPQFPGRQR